VRLQPTPPGTPPGDAPGGPGALAPPALRDAAAESGGARTPVTPGTPAREASQSSDAPQAPPMGRELSTGSQLQRARPQALEELGTFSSRSRSSGGARGGDGSRRFSATTPPGEPPVELSPTLSLVATTSMPLRAAAYKAVPPPLVDNFRLERDDEEEEALSPPRAADAAVSPATLGWDRPDDAPPDGAMLGRWDRGVPQAGRKVRKTRAAPIKPSKWGAIQQAPPGREDVGALAGEARSRSQGQRQPQRAAASPGGALPAIADASPAASARSGASARGAGAGAPPALHAGPSATGAPAALGPLRSGGASARSASGPSAAA